MSTLEAQLLKSIATTSATNSVIECRCAISGSGDVYVTGLFFGTLDIGGGVPTVTTSASLGSSFLAKYSSSLTPISLRSMNSTSDTERSVGYSVAISGSGDVYVTGNFTGTLDIGGGVPTVTTSASLGSSFLAKYSGSLAPLSLRFMSSTSTTERSVGYSVVISGSGDVYVTGLFFGTLDIGDGVPIVTNTGEGGSAFLAKYSGSLTPLSLRSMNSKSTTERSLGGSVAISGSGDVYVTGYFTGTLDIGGGVPTVTTTTNQDSPFLAKYSGSLTPISLRFMSSTSTTESSLGSSVVISGSGDVYVTGFFTGTLDIGGGVPTVTTNTNEGSTFLAKYSGSLTPISLRFMSSTSNTELSFGLSLAVSGSGDVYVTGFFDGTLDIGGGVPPVTNTGEGGSAFLAKYSGSLTPLSLTYIISSVGGSVGYSVAVSLSGDIYVTGNFTGTLDIGNGVPTITNKASDQDGFIAKYLTASVNPICLVSGTPILTDQGIVPIEKINTAIHTIGRKPIVAVTKAITPEKDLICFEPHSVAINCPTRKTIMTPGHEVLYKGKLVQAKHFVGKLNGVHTVPYDGKVVYNVLLHTHGVMSVNNMTLETLHPENKVAKEILNAH
jgi:hypothetical protein